MTMLTFNLTSYEVLKIFKIHLKSTRELSDCSLARPATATALAHELDREEGVMGVGTEYAPTPPPPSEARSTEYPGGARA